MYGRADLTADQNWAHFKFNLRVNEADAMPNVIYIAGRGSILPTLSYNMYSQIYACEEGVLIPVVLSGNNCLAFSVSLGSS